MVPLSFAQARLWFMSQVDPSPSYHVPLVLRLRGPLDIPALSRALVDLLGRHDTLRTVFPATDGVPEQRVRSMSDVDFDLGPIYSTHANLTNLMTTLARQPFDLASDLPLRASLFRVGPDEHVLLLVMHHIACDGWSLAPLVRDLGLAYRARTAGREPDWQPLSVSYADYTAWQRDLLGADDHPTEMLAEQLAYWRDSLAGAPEEIRLPTDRPRRTEPGGQGEWVPVRIDAEVHRGLIDLARSNQATLYIVLQAALAALLTRLGAGVDLPLGAGIAGRTEEALDDLVGLFVNILVLRTDTSGDPTFRELLGRAREVSLAAYANQDVPFERVVEELNPARSLIRHPLFQVMLLLQNTSGTTPEFGDLVVDTELLESDTSKFDLALTLGEAFGAGGGPAGIVGTVKYATDLFDRSTAVRLADRLGRLLTAVLADPDRRLSRLDLLSPDERRQVEVEWNDTTTEYPDLGVAQLFAQRAAERPTATALVHRDRHVTYAELAERANRLAHHLRATGVAPTQRVGVFIERGLDFVVALLATAQCGATYVPLDPAHPDARVDTILAESAPSTVITQESLRRRVSGSFRVVSVDGDRALVEACPSTPCDVPADPAAVLCVMFTSGSTGVPKGVVMPHRALVRTVFGQDYVEFDANLVTLQCAPVSWDAAAFELWSALLHGGTCVLAPGQSPEPAVVDRLVAAHNVNTLFLSTGLFGVIVDEYPAVLGTVRQVMTGGEVPSIEHLRRVDGDFPGVRLVHCYGPVESMVYTNTHLVTRADTRRSVMPIGGPIANTRTFVLDSALHAVPVGVIGELYVAGDGLAYGYHGRPGMTAERFVANPLGAPGELMYRTGDLVRWRADGVLEFFGRSDHQVKIRGFRVEPAEVEIVLGRAPGVRQLAVTVREDVPGDRRLVAYYLGTTGEDELREYAAVSLPEFMVPAAVVRLDSFPLTANGKFDRAALPAPDYTRARTGREPRSPREEILCVLLAEVLGLDSVGIDDNFFQLGGHSLLAARLISRIRTVLGVDIGIRDFFDAPTVAGLGASMDTAQQARPITVVGEQTDPVPLSFAQSRLWLMDRMDGMKTAYNVVYQLRITGPIDPDALRAAVADVVRRHESLRTLFPATDGVPVQHVVPADHAPSVVEVATVAAADLPDRVALVARHDFDLAGELPIRISLFTIGAQRHLMVLVLHHIVSDGWSLGPLLRDVSEAYAARLAGIEPAWQPLPVQYADYALWQQELLGDDNPDGVIPTQLAHWRQALAGAPEQWEFPTDRPRPATPSGNGDVVAVPIDGALHHRLAELAKSQHVTLFMVLHAAFVALLARLGAGADVPVGTPVAGRVDEALDDLIGFFVNTLVLRTDTSGDPTFAELLGRVRATCLAAYGNQDVPFERVVEELNPERSPSRHPLFQVMMVLQNNARAELTFPGVDAKLEPVSTGTAKFDLNVAIEQRYAVDGSPDGLVWNFEYATDLFERTTIELMGARLLRLMAGVLADIDTPIGAVDLLTDDERRVQLTDRNDTADFPRACVHEVFRARARASADAVALVCGDDTVTYGDLDTRADRLAAGLLAQGVAVGDVVGVCLPRGVDMVVAVLAVLKAGAAFTMLDPRFPVARRNDVLARTGARVVVSCGSLSDGLTVEQVVDVAAVPDAGALPAELPSVDPRQPACVMFTSGSTGRPKGVLAPHRAVVGTLVNQSYADFGGVWLQCAPMSWDAFLLELFGPLLAGATCVLQPGEIPEPEVIADLVRRRGVTTMHVSASLLNFLVDNNPTVFADVRCVLTGGEPASMTHVDRLLGLAPGLRLVNGYSPVENMIFTLCHDIGHADLLRTSVPVGRPIGHKRVYVLDDRLGLTPPGVVGELYMAGVGLAHGYVGQPGLTAGRFVANPFGQPGERMYRTGDLARWRSDGVLEFLGRSDQQVKIRGFRVEPAEVETVLTGCPGVRQAAVVVREDRPGDKRLVGYVVGDVVGDVVRDFAAGMLPDFMVPAAVLVLDVLPLTANGKLDRAALPVPEFTAKNGRTARNPQEELLCGLYVEVLGLESVGVEDSFFDLGGHSLLAARLVSRIRTVAGVEVSIRTIFDAPTVAGLAARIATAGKARPALKRRTPERSTP